MKAVVLDNESKFPTYKDISISTPSSNEGKVKLVTAGLNRRDLVIINNSTVTNHPCILGSEGAGTIVEIGKNVTNFNIGDHVIINPSLEWVSKKNPPHNPKILGFPQNGTFAEYVIISKENLAIKPAFLSWHEAGVLSLSALTAYRALFTKGSL